MRAVVAEDIGPWRSVLKLAERPPIQQVPQGALHVEVSACGMGFPDLLQVEGKYQQKAQPPFVPVNYISGRVLSVGDGVDAGAFQIGDRVVGNAAADGDGHMCGGLAEQALLRASSAHRVPDGMGDAVVLSMHENYWDVHNALFACGRLQRGDMLLVLGASGACGMAAIDLGKTAGASVVACASTDDKLQACRAAGADHLVNYGQEPDYDALIATLREAELYGKPNVVFDPVGSRYAEAAFRSMARGGRHVVFGFASGGTDPKQAFPSFPINLLLMKAQQIVGAMGRASAEQVQEMFQLVQDGRLTPGVATADGAASAYTLESFVEAFDDVANRRAIGKVIISVT